MPEGEAVTNPTELKTETELAALSTDSVKDEDKPGTPSVYGCPDCGGVLWELQDDRWLRFRCRVGHAFSAEGLLRAQTDSLESALWAAFRNLHEAAALSRRLAARARGKGHDLVAERLAVRAQSAEEQAELIRSLLVSGRLKVAANGEGQSEDEKPGPGIMR
jgi:two-component system chemotaxis response regulator CheB